MMSWFTRLFKKQTKVDYSSEKPPSYSPSSKASTFKSQLNGDISPELLDSFKTDFLASPQSKLAQTVIANSTMVELLTNRDAIIRNPHVFSDKIELEGNITNQNKSGVCWIFAATNTLRLKLMKKYNLESFEFSQNYLFFYDKLEKANFFLENVIQLSDKDPKSRVIQKLFAGPADDGIFF